MTGHAYSAEHNPYPHERYDEVVNTTMRLAGDSMGMFLDAMKSYVMYTAAQNVPGAKESGVGYYYDTKKKTMKRYLFYRIGSGYPRQTNRPLDFKIDGKGFFVIQLPGGWTAYTHDGRFKLDKDGQLVMLAPNNFPVLGENGPIYLPDNNIEVNENGEIFHGGHLVDVFRVENVKNRFDLHSFNQTIFHLSKEDYETGDKFIEPNYKIKQGFVEDSSVTKAYIGLVPEWKNGHESNVKIVKQYARSMQSAIAQADPR